MGQVASLGSRGLAATLWFVVWGCGRVNFDSRSDANDASDATGQLGPPMVVGELTVGGVDADDPTLTADMLEIYFASSRPGGVGSGDIWRSIRNSVDEPWQPPVVVTELDSASVEESPGITADGLEMYFTSDRGGGNDIWASTRPTRGDMWAAPTVVAELSTGSGDFQPQPSATKLRIVFYRSSGNRDIYEATRTAVGATWQSPAVLANVNSAAGDRSPCLDGSELTMVFSSDRDSATADVQDLYLATRASLTDPFGAAQPLTDLNSQFDDDSAWLSSDGHVLFFSSDRSGTSEIYVTQR
ncbi:MAG TPA: hypothetical protein VFV99_07030 [Kofleriaceae bacterium]|nr:hypothetical protein [Kofleriaceae bacterium]